MAVNRSLSQPFSTLTLGWLAVVLVLCGSITGRNAAAGEFEDAVRAYDQGNLEAAIIIFEQLAQQGNALAQYNLGWMLDNGEGVPEDDAEAVRWYRKAAEQGDADAQHNLGWMLDNGEGIPEDDTEAVRWYRKAAEQGLADAQNNLGRMYADGAGVPQDDVSAYAWASVAAAQGLIDSKVLKAFISRRLDRPKID